MTAPELDVFDCPACGAHVRLEDAARTTCPSCGADVAMPAPHIEARALAGVHEALGREALEIAARVGRAPHPALQLLTIFESSCAFALLLPFAAMAGTVVSAVLLRSLAPRIGVAADDDRWLTFGTFLVTALGWGGGWVLATYAGKRVAGLRELQAGLAAKPPTREGGAASCRNCGAPLSIRDDALAVRCRHCGAECLVAVPARWLELARGSQEKRSDSLVAAAAAWDAEVARMRKAARIRMAGVLLVAGPIVGLVGALVLGSPKTVRETPWQNESRAPRLMVDRDYVSADHDAFSPMLSPRTCDDADKPRGFRFPPVGCDGDGCTVPWYVGLASGDRIRLSTREAGASLVLFYPAGDPPFPKASRGELLKKGKPKPGEDVELVAPNDGFYLVLFHQDGATPDRTSDLCAQLVR